MPDGSNRYRTIETIRGDPNAFRTAARQRSEEGRRVSYVHIISPENSRDLEDKDLLGLSEMWSRDKNGHQLEHYAAVHQDGDRPHLHVMVARDKFIKRDMEQRKERTREQIREREMVRGIDRDEARQLETERVQAQEQQRQRECDQVRTHDRDDYEIER